MDDEQPLLVHLVEHLSHREVRHRDRRDDGQDEETTHDHPARVPVDERDGHRDREGSRDCDDGRDDVFGGGLITHPSGLQACQRKVHLDERKVHTNGTNTSSNANTICAPMTNGMNWPTA